MDKTKIAYVCMNRATQVALDLANNKMSDDEALLRFIAIIIEYNRLTQKSDNPYQE